MRRTCKPPTWRAGRNTTLSNVRLGRQGSVLMEFAMIALVSYLAIVAVIEFGRLLFGAQTVQAAVEQAAREISRTPLPPVMEFSELFDPSQDANALTVYDPNFLAIDISGWSGTESLQNYVAGLGVPSVNLALYPLMFIDTVGGTPILRYPGALVTSSQPAGAKSGYSGFSVSIPVVTSAPGVSPETVEWHDVLEEITDATGVGPFSVTAATSTGVQGVVAVRLNYPFQAASMSGFQPNSADPTFGPDVGNPMQADDSGVTASNSVSGGGSPTAPDTSGNGKYSGPYGGTYGLGAQGALGKTVRPFRRLISVQALFRREVFGPTL